MKTKTAIFLFGLMLLPSLASASSGAPKAQLTVAAVEAKLAAISAELQTLVQQATQQGVIEPLGGDFAGGITPSQLWSASASSNTVTPVLSNLNVPGNATVTGNETVGGNLLVTNPASVTSISSASLLLPGSTIYGGTGTPTVFTTSTTVTPPTFCGADSLIIMNNASGVTSTISLPNLASVQSSTPATGGCGPLNPGSDDFQNIYNSSTANLVINASSGIVFKLSPSSTWPGGSSSSSVIIPPGAVMKQEGQDISATLFFITNTLYQ